MMSAQESKSEGLNKPIALTIAGLDPSGGAGIIADTRTFSSLGCYPTAVITSITFQNTVGVFGALHQSAAVVRNQIEPLVNDFEIGAVKTGMLPTSEVVEEIAKLLDERRLTNLVVDPVFVSTSGHDLIAPGAFESIKKLLLPRSLIITPNIPEAEQLVGFSITSTNEMYEAARVIRGLGARTVLIKGGHLLAMVSDELQGEVIDVFLDENGNFMELSEEFLPVGDVHGSGCVLSAAITANLAHNVPLAQAVRNAKKHMTNALRSAPHIGHGSRPL